MVFFATASTIHIFFWKCTSSIGNYYSPWPNFGALRLLPAVFATEPWMRWSERAALSGMVCMTFISDRGYDVSPQGRNSAQKKRIDLTLRKIWCLVAQRVDFTEMWNLPHLRDWAGSVRPYLQNGVKVAPLGQERPKLPIDFLWCRTAHEMT